MSMTERSPDATAGERRYAPIRRAREDWPRPEGMGDDRLRLASRARRKVFDQAQHDADPQSLERRLETAAAERRRRRRRRRAEVETQGKKEGSRRRGPPTLSRHREGGADFFVVLGERLDAAGPGKLLWSAILLGKAENADDGKYVARVIEAVNDNVGGFRSRPIPKVPRARPLWPMSGNRDHRALPPR